VVLARYNNNIMSLDTRLTISRFVTLAKPGETKLVGDQVRGKIVEGYVVVTDPVLMAERFANWPSTAASIFNFTRKYGPLKSTEIVEGWYTVKIKEWCQWQRYFQGTWRMTAPPNLAEAAASLGIGPHDMGRGIRLGDGSFLTFQRSGAELLLKDMWTLIDVCLSVIPLERLRVCKALDCATPYFVAHHLKQTLCGADQCKRWNELRLKREWFEREKGPILEKRKRLRKGENDGTQKTR
jgi:hypothetical protein